LLSLREIKVKTDIETLKLNIEGQFTISAGRYFCILHAILATILPHELTHSAENSDAA